LHSSNAPSLRRCFSTSVSLLQSLSTASPCFCSSYHYLRYFVHVLIYS
jgi:hypothetical protein